MKKIFFCFFIFIASFLFTSCSDDRERIVTVKIRGGNEFNSISKLQIIQSYDEEEVEVIEIKTENKEGRYTTRRLSILDGSRLEFRVFPGDKHIFEGFTGDLKNDNTIAYLEVNGDKNVEALFHFKPEIIDNEPPLNGSEYLINHSSHLRWIASKITSTPSDTFSGKTIKLEDDIYMDNIAFNGIASSSVGVKFEGTLDGNGHGIYDINIVGDGNTTVGLVGNLASTGSIKNLSLTGTMTLSDIEYAGAFVGNGPVSGALPTVENVYSEVNINVTSIAFTSLVGGIAGNNVNIKKAYNSGSIILNSLTLGSVAAGIIGGKGDIENVYNTGEITGAKDTSVAGICGGIGTGTIRYAYNTGSLFVIDATPNSKKGGIMINNTGTVNSVYFLRINGSFNDGVITIANDPTYPDNFAYSLEQFQFMSVFAGFDPTIWQIKSGLKAGNGSKNIVVAKRPVLIGLGEGK